MENLDIQSVLTMLKTLGIGWRASRDSKPGLIIWLKGEIVAGNFPLEVSDCCSKDWRAFEDNTEIRE